ncbi:hypothetical protein ACQPT2_20835 [Erwinia amylovora]
MTDTTQNIDRNTPAATDTAAQTAITTAVPATAAVNFTPLPQLTTPPAPAPAAYDSLHAQVMSDPVAVTETAPPLAAAGSIPAQVQADLAAVNSVPASSMEQAGSLVANDPLLDKVGKLLSFIGHDVSEFKEIVALAQKLIAK